MLWVVGPEGPPLPVTPGLLILTDAEATAFSDYKKSEACFGFRGPEDQLGSQLGPNGSKYGTKGAFPVLAHPAPRIARLEVQRRLGIRTSESQLTPAGKLLSGEFGLWGERPPGRVPGFAMRTPAVACAGPPR